MLIKKMKVCNYKKFKDKKTIVFNNHKNIFAGINGAGKSSLLKAIMYVLSGSYSLMEKENVYSLLNIDAVLNFINLDDKFVNNLPSMYIELYLDEEFDKDNYDLKGKVNSESEDTFGLKMEFAPNYEDKNLKNFLNRHTDIFPFDYYKLSFKTFSGSNYNSFNKPTKKIKYYWLDTSKVNTSSSLKKFSDKIINSKLSEENMLQLSSEFKDKLNELNEDLDNYIHQENNDFTISFDTSNKNSIKKNIQITKSNVVIQNLSMGEQLLIALTDFGVQSKDNDYKNILLLEEPENHLSSLYMNKLINELEKDNEFNQIFIATHSNKISSRLDLKNLFVIGNDNSVLSLKDVDESVTNFFKKSTNTNLLDFILSDKVILVEGNAEYILMEKFYSIISGHSSFDDNTAIISVGGKIFNQYLEIAKELNKNVAVITDNDCDKNGNSNYVSVSELYTDYVNSNTKVFYDKNEENYTFEISLFNNNKEWYQEYINQKHSRVRCSDDGIKKFLLNNKTKVALDLLNYLDEDKSDFCIPDYVKEAITWLKRL